MATSMEENEIKLTSIEGWQEIPWKLIYVRPLNLVELTSVESSMEANLLPKTIVLLPWQ